MSDLNATTTTAMNDCIARDATIAKLQDHKASLVRALEDASNEIAERKQDAADLQRDLDAARKDRASIVAFLHAKADGLEDSIEAMQRHGSGAEASVLAAARAYRDAHARCLAVGLDPPDGIDMDAAADSLLTAATFLTDAAEPNPTVSSMLPTDPAAERRMDLLMSARYAAQTRRPIRPWPDPEAYKALAEQVFGQRDPAAGGQPEVAPAVAAWKALRDGQQVLCARGYVWTAKRTGEHLRFAMARPDGKPGKVIEQPWYPCIMARLPVWPIVVETAG